MNVLGIVATPGLDPVSETQIAEMKSVLNRCFLRTQARSRKECDPVPDFKTTRIFEMEEAPLIANSLRDAKAAILVCDVSNLTWVAGLGHKLQELDRDNVYNLRGKWFGIIIHGSNDPWRIEEPAQRVLYEFNSAGMTPLPQALVHLRTREDRKHLRLGVDLADMLASQSEWTGRAEQSKAA